MAEKFLHFTKEVLILQGFKICNECFRVHIYSGGFASTCRFGLLMVFLGRREGKLIGPIVLCHRDWTR